MEATSIRQLLKGFCDNMQWKYGVFWKLNDCFPLTLTWETGYEKRNEAMESMWSDINLKSPVEVHSSGDCSAQLFMIEMCNRKYRLGEGIIGKIPLARDHFWVLCEDILTNKFDTDLISECPDEWLLQFASGIKVAEDIEFVTNITKQFHSIHCLEANTNSGIDFQDWSFSALSHDLIDSLDESSSYTNTILNGEVSASASLNANEPTRLHPTMLSFIQDDRCMLRENQLKSLKRSNENEIFSSSIEMSTDPRHIGHVERKPNHKDEIWAQTHLVQTAGAFGEISNGLNSYPGKNMTEQQFGGMETGHDDIENVNDFFTFPSECELHKAHQSVSYDKTGKSVQKYISVDGSCSSSTLISIVKEHDHDKGLEFPEEVDPEYLLDAVFGNLCSASDDTTSISNSVRSLVTMPIEFTGSIQPKFDPESSSLVVNNSDGRSDLIPRIKSKDEIAKHLTSPSFVGNSSLLMIDETRKEKVNSHRQPISVPKNSSTTKKRARVDNNRKPRPRDRQMIMDRMKELRELIPDGGRCSIDNLLERTIKHMMYLRKITSQAEKLKRFADQEVPKWKKQKINGSYPGRSCAFDFESELAWPIVIEDLECTGHMLIEMVCNEHGLFLEIVQVIRKLDITIMKGILENRSNTSWACFIIEVPRGFHRMDVLCPLLHLLQLRGNPVSES
ncbi:transcription factor bHLH155-like isoform X2 [Lotus japonicus]|uniref:transcription factor bHLH155-like isoform X2 n=1 Tax=Lotus japonicus TaxID=34305 RepID=UPI00258F8542|nr:transcription factor bHLH155-like isoform X2 [Lotus japonicus]